MAVGEPEVDPDGTAVGLIVIPDYSVGVGDNEGTFEGKKLGKSHGEVVGGSLGMALGLELGVTDGVEVGKVLGDREVTAYVPPVGPVDGDALGDDEVLVDGE